MTDTATQVKRDSAAVRVLRRMADGQWHTNVDLTRPHIGGNRGVGRLWEVEKKHSLKIMREKIGIDQWRYRWVDHWRLEEVLGAAPKVEQGKLI